MTRYLGTSSLLKLYVDEPGSVEVLDRVESADVVATLTLTYTEVRAALARRRRERLLSPRGLAGGRRLLDTEWPAFIHLDVTPALCAGAGDLAERYRLRAYDSLHLAAYEIALGAGVDQTFFSSADLALCRAAKALAKALSRP
ncbi:putative nucleic acid-binding protein, contains PIN domain [Luteitalea pratensis]|uniref:Putative nucleic acid-binding protein, contains PIN domain n=1 Tax=Luteitalea pratensis TaxID=1855912 RepID=A0A143PYK9_LUTPR|nr:type II toxin-antitoxin system VapC family toxin [Luteitalea pratensis]AMY12879.1 putative nucleic acid-binding protein, contains PIN domain [Luteitalea pratensis]